jgi:hypothetical protein
MKRLTLIAILAISFPAIAEDAPPDWPPSGTPTTLTTVPQSLADLLSAGWTVVSTGAEADAFIMTDGRKRWIRCVLMSKKGSPSSMPIRVEFASAATSICQALN